MVARLMRENSFRFLISHKLILMTNHKPTLDHMDDAMRGRLHLVPFDRIWNRPGHPERDARLPDGDKDLMEQLQLEAPGVLAWLVAGAVRYAQQGLVPPQDVTSMTRSYFAEQDPISQWMEGYDRCDAKHGTSAADLFKDFGDWQVHKGSGAKGAPKNDNAFGRTLHFRHGVTKQRKTPGIFYGLTRKPPASVKPSHEAISMQDAGL